MPLAPFNASPTERQEIGSLTVDAGTAAQMNYCPVVWGGSGAYLTNAAVALATTFFYPNAMAGGNSGGDIGAPLNLMINPNLDAGYPVLLGVSGGPDEPHAVVCDGYGYDSASLYHHLNLGLVQKLIGILRRAERVIPLWKGGMLFDGDFAHLEV